MAHSLLIVLAVSDLTFHSALTAMSSLVIIPSLPSVLPILRSASSILTLILAVLRGKAALQLLLGLLTILLRLLAVLLIVLLLIGSTCCQLAALRRLQTHQIPQSMLD